LPQDGTCGPAGFGGDAGAAVLLNPVGVALSTATNALSNALRIAVTVAATAAYCLHPVQPRPQFALSLQVLLSMGDRGLRRGTLPTEAQLPERLLLCGDLRLERRDRGLYPARRGDQRVRA
jgi:hypothetical protein